MPELPEVETVCRGLARRLTARRLVRVEVRRPDLRFPLPDDLATRLTGRRVACFGRRGKYVLMTLDDGTVVIMHLGMSGRLFVSDHAPKAPGVHDHVVITCDDDTTMTYTDHRRFGVMTLARDDTVERHPLLADMGPEPLDDAFDGALLAERLNGKHTPIKAALLDQRVVAGLGNIYVCEALFHAGLSPRRKAYTVRGGRADKLAAAIRRVLNEAIAAGGSSLRDYVQASGELGYFQHNFAVYHRAGQPCPGCDCGGGVRRIVQSGRSTFYCAKRQR
jgi:formamidopyrimidine-DNA glycosylase